MPFNSFENYTMSWKPDIQSSDKPLYITLAEQLQTDIQNGTLAPGTKLPPQRELADYLDINVSTVSRAFKICSQKGLLTGTVGSGTFVTYDVFTNLANDTADRQHEIELGSMMPETVPQDEMLDLLRELLAEADSAKYFQYTLGIATWQLDAAARLLKRVGCPAEREQILVASGGQNALAGIFTALFRSGDRLGVDPLVYPGVKSLAKLYGIQLVPIAQKNGEMSCEGIRNAVKNDGIKALYVVPDCQNPTCHTMSEDSRQGIGEVARELNLLLIEDGINSLLDDRQHHSIRSYAPKQTVFILSLSKTVSPALRLAYLAVPEQYRGAIDNALYNIDLSQSSLMLELASRLIVSGELDALLQRRAAGIIRRNAIAEEVLSGFTLCGDSHCLARWLILPEGMSGATFEKEALKRGVHVYGSERFVVGKDCPIGAARLAICAPDSIESLREGLLRLKKIIE